MRAVILFVVFVAALAARGACAELFERIEFDRQAYPAIRKIAVLPIAESRNVQIRNSGSAGGAVADLLLLGLGSVTEAVTDTENTKQFVKAVNERKLRMGVPMANALRAELLRNGMGFAYLANQKVSLTSDKKAFDFNAVGTDADAILFVFFGQTGYVSGAFSATYAPRAVVGVVLVESRTRKPIYSRVFCSGCKPALKDAESLDPDKAYQFDSFEQLMAKLDDAVEGIRSEHRKIAACVVAAVKPAADATKPVADGAKPAGDAAKPVTDGAAGAPAN